MMMLKPGLNILLQSLLFIMIHKQVMEKIFILSCKIINICRSSSASLTYTNGAATESWYSEISNWNFSTSSPINTSQATGHFTQVVWVDSTHAGFGMATGMYFGYHAIWIVARYSPPGNYVGQYSSNVLQI